MFSDEVYRELEHDPAGRLPAACDEYERAVSLGSISKSYGLPGLRTGWIATRDAGLREAVLTLKDYTTICASAPSEFLTALALRHRQVLLDRNLAIVRRNLPLLDGFFERHAGTFAWIRPTASPIGFPRVTGFGDLTRFCEQLAEAGVLLLPGAVYDQPDHVRIGFGRANMPDALNLLEASLTNGWSRTLCRRRRQHVTACVMTRSGGLPQLDPVALRIGDPAEPADTLHVLRLAGHVRSLGAQLREHRIQVADPEVEHGLLGAGPEVAGPGLERREYRRPGSLTPQAVLIGVQAQAIAIPRAQGRRVGGPHEVPADSKHTFHAAILPGRRSGGLAPRHCRLCHHRAARAPRQPPHPADADRPEQIIQSGGTLM